MDQYLDLSMLLAGLGLFLFGMNILESALKQLSGKKFRLLLRQSTNKPLRSIFGGILATTVVQSSSLVSLIVLAFVGAGIIPLANAIGIVIGSNLGTTFTGWIVATLGFKLDIGQFIYPFIALGGLSYGLCKRFYKNISLLLIGFALLLLGLSWMKESVQALTQLVNVDYLSGYPLIIYLIFGAIFTAVIQSSSAAMMITLSALYAGIIPLPAAAALVIGADLGTTSTVFIGSLQGGMSKRRLAMAHVLFNFSVDAVAFLLLYPLLNFIVWLQLTDSLYSLVAFHSLFNLFGLILFLPLINQFAELLEKWYPEESQLLNQYIHKVPVSESETAIEVLSKEVQHLLHSVIYLNLRYLDANKNKISNLNFNEWLPSSFLSAEEEEAYRRIKGLEGEIISYGLKIKISDFEQSLSPPETIAKRVDELINAARHAVNSAKAYKDIRQDFLLFYELDNDYFKLTFNALKDNAIGINKNMMSLLYSEKSILEKGTLLNQAEIDILNFHQKMTSNIYLENQKINLSTIELSTLLNVNKEIQTSAESLTKSLRLGVDDL